MKKNQQKTRKLYLLGCALVTMFCLLIRPATAQQQVILTDNYSNAALWTQTNSPSATTHGTVSVTGGVALFNGLTFDGNDLTNRAERRIYRPLPTVSPTLNQPSFKVDFEFGQNGETTQPAAVAFAITAGTLDATYNQFSPAVPNNQDNMSVTYVTTINTDRPLYLIGASRDGAVTNSAANIIIQPGVVYYVRLERLDLTHGRISVFTDAARTIHIAGSPQCFDVSPTLAPLTYIQHGSAMGSGDQRLVDTAYVDNLTVTNVYTDITGPSTLCKGATATYSVFAQPGASYTWSLSDPTASIVSGQGTNSIVVMGGSNSGTVSVTNTAACNSVASLSYTNPVLLTTTQTNPACYGGNTGTATVSVVNPSGSYNYSWNTSPVQSTATATGLSTGNYTVTVTNASGCSNTASVTITQPASPLVATATLDSLIGCDHQGTTYTVTATGGIPPYSGIGVYPAPTPGSYSVAVVDANGQGCTSFATIFINAPRAINPGAVQTAPILCHGGSTNVLVTANGSIDPYMGTGLFPVTAGSYTFVITDTTGCSDSVSITITEPDVLTANAVQGNAILCNGGTTTITVSAAGGTAPYTGTGTFTRNAGTYTFTVRDANGCTTTTTITVTEPTMLTASVTQNAPILCNGGSTTVTVSAAGGTAPYTGTGTFTVGAGTFNYVVTDANGCTVTKSITVTQPTVLTASVTQNAPILCFGGSTTVTVSAAGGTAPYTGTGTFTVGAGTFNYVVTDANGCTITKSITVTQPTVLTASVVQNAPILCNGGSTTVTVSADGGTAPYTGTGTFTVGAGTFNYVVTDANGCTVTKSITVTQPTVLTASVTQNAPILCNGGSTTVTVSADGGTAPYTGTGTFTVGAGTFNYVVTDANGCTITKSITVTEPTMLTASVTQNSPILCNGGTTTVTVSAAGGTAPYTGTGTFTVGAGTFNYVVTDANGCTVTKSITVTQPTVLTASVTQNSPILCNAGTTTVTVSAAGGTAPYTGTGTFTVGAGTFNYVVTDANGCTITKSITVTQPTVLTASVTQNAIIACNGGSTTVTVSAAGGTAPYTGTGTFTVSAGTYSYTVTDANGCSVTKSVTVTQPAVLTASVTQNAPILCFGGSTTVTVSAAGGTAPYSGTGTFTATAGSHSYTVTDAHGCTAVTSITISQPATPVSAAIAPLALDRCGRDIQITRGYGPQSVQLSGSASGGTAPYTYSWSPAASLNNASVANPVASPTVTTTYTLTVHDANGCTSTATIVVNVLDVRCGTLLGQQLVRVCNTTIVVVAGVTTFVQEELCVLKVVAATLLATNPNACLGECGALITVDIHTGLAAYPNPFSQTVTIEINGQKGVPASLDILDLTGKTLISQSIERSERDDKTNFVWNGEDAAGNKLTDGIYLCRVTIGNSTETIRIALQR